VIGATTLLALALLLAGVATAVLPGVPAGLVSLAGVAVYWWGTGFAQPGPVLLIALAAVGILMLAADWLGGVVAARAGGAATTTSVAAGVVGLVLLVATGPVGMLLGAAVTVFTLEYRRGRDARAGATAAGTYVLGFLASGAVQALLALSMFVGVLVVAV
jgi:uncharacterized protein YqgC (DUF456 family)